MTPEQHITKIAPEYRISPDDPQQIEWRRTKPRITEWEPFLYYATAQLAEYKLQQIINGL